MFVWLKSINFFLVFFSASQSNVDDDEDANEEAQNDNATATSNNNSDVDTDSDDSLSTVGSLQDSILLRFSPVNNRNAYSSVFRNEILLSFFLH